MSLFKKKTVEKVDNVINEIDMNLKKYVMDANNALLEIFEKISNSGISVNEKSLIFNESGNFYYVNGVGVGTLGQMFGCILDDNLKKIAVFSFGSTDYEEYLATNAIKHRCEILNYSDIISVNIINNNQVSYSVSVSDKNVVKRSLIGGALAGEVGAIIGAVTADKKINIQPSSGRDSKLIISFDSDIVPDISFGYHGSYLKDNYEKLVSTYKGDYIRYHACNYMLIKAFDEAPIEDSELGFLDNGYSFNETLTLWDTNKFNSFLSEVAIQFSNIIKICENEVHVKKEKSNLIDELKEIKALYDSGVLTDDEFSLMKKKLIEKI